MADLSCRTSLIDGGYFNLHTIKLPLETYSRYRMNNTSTSRFRLKYLIHKEFFRFSFELNNIAANFFFYC